MAQKNQKFEEAIKTKKIPVLTLDKKFLDLVSAVGKTESIEQYIIELNDLLKAQGKANTEIKEIKNLKKKLMQQIVDNTDEKAEISLKEKEKINEDNTRLINECNEKIQKYEDDILDIPVQIDEVNRKLMLELMDNCYSMLKSNERDIEETAKWITQVRIELKKRLVKKTDMETKNQQIYSYMHDIFGS